MDSTRNNPSGGLTPTFSKWVNGILKFYKRSTNVEFFALDPNGLQVMGTGLVKHIRTRLTIAQINAGATLLAAVPGYKYRMLECSAIAVGGAVAAVTAVEVRGTLSSARILVSFAQASLTQSTELRAGDTGSTILADGASFTQNDANTAITVIKAGADITTATHVDVLFTYALEV